MKYPLMTFEEYLRLAPFPNPYLYTIHSKGRYLYYLGVHHCFDPNNSIFKVIEHYWYNFLKFAENKKVIVLVEGGKRSVEEFHHLEEVIKNHGEAGFIASLAKKEGFEHDSPEPDIRQETDELLKDFSKDEILTYYFTRGVSQWNRLSRKPDFNLYLQKSLDQYKRDLGWDGELFMLSRRKEYFEKLSGQKFVYDDYQLMTSLDNPIELKTKINEVSRKSGEIRNDHIIDEIKRQWDQGKNIFVVYGSAHAIVQEKALKEILSQTNST